MNFIIYHPNSFGGNYDYAILLFEAFQAQKHLNCTILLPKNAGFEHPNALRILPKDLTKGPNWYKKLFFLYRSFASPLRLWAYIRTKGKVNVLFNDYEQISSFLWAPLFRLSRAESSRYGVVLHDPDRDAYFPSPSISGWCIRQMMKLMDIGFYHDILPDKSYYTPNGRSRYVPNHVGIFPSTLVDSAMLEKINNLKQNSILMIIPGNIRPEKNYHLAIEALSHFPDLCLLIAGRKANSGVNINLYHQQAEKLKVSDRIIWLEFFLTDGQMAACIEASDIVILNYSASFKSQSAVLCLVAPYKKRLICSDGRSALANTVKHFELGIAVEPDNFEALRIGLKQTLQTRPESRLNGWDAFLKTNTWQNTVQIMVDAFEQPTSFNQKI